MLFHSRVSIKRREPTNNPGGSPLKVNDDLKLSAYIGRYNQYFFYIFVILSDVCHSQLFCNNKRKAMVYA